MTSRGNMDARHMLLKAAMQSGCGHVPSSLSVLDIISVLYDNVLGDDDHFILSKGHAALALYTVLAERGLIDVSELSTMGSIESRLGGHPDRVKLRGLVETSTGSLGHGLPQAVGIAIGKKIKEEPGVVYCLIGDGEALESTTMESSALALAHRLGNLCLLVDDNGSCKSSLGVPNFKETLLAQGWNVYVANGHDSADIERSVRGLSKETPLCVIMKTVKGKGVSEMEQDPGYWHRRIPSVEMIDRANKES